MVGVCIYLYLCDVFVAKLRNSRKRVTPQYWNIHGHLKCRTHLYQIVKCNTMRKLRKLDDVMDKWNVDARWVFACANNCLNPLFYGIVGKRLIQSHTLSLFLYTNSLESLLKHCKNNFSFFFLTTGHWPRVCKEQTIQRPILETFDPWDMWTKYPRIFRRT